MVRILAVTKSRHYALRIRGRSAGEKSRNAGDLFHGIPLSQNPTRRQRCGKVYGCLVEYPQHNEEVAIIRLDSLQWFWFIKALPHRVPFANIRGHARLLCVFFRCIHTCTIRNKCTPHLRVLFPLRQRPVRVFHMFG